MGWLTTLYILITPVLKANKVLSAGWSPQCFSILQELVQLAREIASHWRDRLRLSELGSLSLSLSLSKLIRPFSFSYTHAHARLTGEQYPFITGTLTSKFFSFVYTPLASLSRSSDFETHYGSSFFRALLLASSLLHFLSRFPSTSMAVTGISI